MKVIEIVPIAVIDVREATYNYSIWFPGAESFLCTFNIGDTGKKRDFNQLIAFAVEQAQNKTEVLNVYAQTSFPLGLLSKLLGLNIPDTINVAVSEQSAGQKLAVRHQDEPPFDCNATSTIAEQIVVTRSAVVTMSRVSALRKVLEVTELASSVSFAHEAQEWVKQAKKDLHGGVTRFGVDGQHNPISISIEANDSRLQAIVTDRTAMLNIVQALKLEAIPYSQAKELSEFKLLEEFEVGKTDACGIALASDKNAMLWADDLGLAAIAKEYSDIKTISSFDVIRLLRQRGIISEAEERAGLLELVSLGYVHCPTNIELVVDVMVNGSSSDRVTSRVLDTLLYGIHTMDQSIEMVSEILYRVNCAQLTIKSNDELIRVILRKMNQRWLISWYGIKLLQRCTEKFSLLPTRLDEIKASILRFLKEVAV
ncbi:MAG: hypothetical protein IPM83_12410 [Ignavibacteria bacterium]|nr:hypothetical protein [Ignavibacteria bacterium]